MPNEQNFVLHMSYWRRHLPSWAHHSKEMTHEGAYKIIITLYSRVDIILSASLSVPIFNDKNLWVEEFIKFHGSCFFGGLIFSEECLKAYELLVLCKKNYDCHCYHPKLLLECHRTRWSAPMPTKPNCCKKKKKIASLLWVFPF